MRIVGSSSVTLSNSPTLTLDVNGLTTTYTNFVGGAIDSLFFKSTLPTPTFGTGGIVWAALTLALMTVPVVIVATFRTDELSRRHQPAL